MTKEEFIDSWCKRHGLTREFFDHRLEAIPWQHTITNPDYGDSGWIVITNPNMHYKMRLPVRVVQKIVSELVTPPAEQRWDWTSPGGNVLVARRSQSSNEYGNYDSLDFIWNEDD